MRRLAPDDTQETDPDSGKSTSKDGRPRLMIVDDDEDLLKLCDAALARNFEITLALDGIEAIEKIVQYEPDLIVIDALMPRMSGYQLCQSLRRNRRFATTPIIFASGKSSQKDIAYANRIGGDDFLPKPYDMTELRDKLLEVASRPGFVQHQKRLPIDEIRKREEMFAKERSRRERDRNMRAAGGRSDGPEKEEGELEAFVRRLSQENPPVE
jgi:twitching motility two-component system response regulator PilG